MTGEDLAKIAYAAYGQVTDFKNYQGLPMPTWEELPEKIKSAWIAAAKAAVTEAFFTFGENMGWLKS